MARVYKRASVNLCILFCVNFHSDSVFNYCYTRVVHMLVFCNVYLQMRVCKYIALQIEGYLRTHVRKLVNCVLGMGIYE